MASSIEELSSGAAELKRRGLWNRIPNIETLYLKLGLDTKCPRLG